MEVSHHGCFEDQLCYLGGGMGQAVTSPLSASVSSLGKQNNTSQGCSKNQTCKVWTAGLARDKVTRPEQVSSYGSMTHGPQVTLSRSMC